MAVRLSSSMVVPHMAAKFILSSMIVIVIWLHVYPLFHACYSNMAVYYPLLRACYSDMAVCLSSLPWLLQ
jgi:hypothetical protein